MNRNFTNKQTNKLGLSISYLLICSFLSMYDYNIAIVMALFGSFFITKYHALQYWSLAIMLLIRSQSDIVLSSSDLAKYLEYFNLIGNGANPYSEDIFSGGEVLLQTFFWLLSRIVPTLTINELSFVFVFLFLLVFYPIAKIFKKTPIVVISLVLFLDVILIVHLFRQSVSSIFLLLGIMRFCNEGKHQKQKGLLLYLLAGFTHSTNFLYGIIGIIFVKIPVKYLKLTLILCGIFGFFLPLVDLFEKLTSLFHGVAILDKASYVLSLVGSSTGGFRIFGLITFILSLVVFNSHPLFRIFLGFAALALFFYTVPILSARIGLISSSILTGLIIGLFLNKIKKSSLLTKLATLSHPA